ncbi:6-phosphogluconolactonase, partial [candidate division WOR-3 bacterium]|nr:6-phosphogluconolactonase [candidate division WOR-3 bacterium]
MKIEIYETKEETAEAAARKASEVLNAVVKQNGRTNFIAATGASQFDFLEALTSDKSIDWGKTTIFHLDEYVGISEQHPASFRRYLKERLIDKVHPENVYLIEGNAKDP